jgi:hypothetical protein
MPDTQAELHSDPRCQTCIYVMPSYSASTGLRCGLKYFQSSVLMRKFQRMEHYPEVKEFNACEAWSAVDASTAS